MNYESKEEETYCEICAGFDKIREESGQLLDNLDKLEGFLELMKREEDDGER